jgi:hypothetical protein
MKRGQALSPDTRSRTGLSLGSSARLLPKYGINWLEQ